MESKLKLDGKKYSTLPESRQDKFCFYMQKQSIKLR